MPNHGKLGRVLIRNENGLVGSGLNDVTWGAYGSASDSSYFEVEIDAEGTPDTFQWRENGGAWTTGVAITGAAQNLAGANGTQVITFAATTGHTLGDKWVIGNLYQEATTESGSTAQITDATMRILNPNASIVFTDDGGANVIWINYATGTAYFDAAVGNVTVTATNGFIPSAGLEAAGYMYNWNFGPTLDLADITAFQDDWKSSLAGQAGASGSAQGYFLGNKWFNLIHDNIEAKVLLKLFSYDPDADGTGDHFIAWAQFKKFDLTANIGVVVNNKLDFDIFGAPGFTANS